MVPRRVADRPGAASEIAAEAVTCRRNQQVSTTVEALLHSGNTGINSSDTVVYTETIETHKHSAYTSPKQLWGNEIAFSFSLNDDLTLPRWLKVRAEVMFLCL